jgi:hypothetical protein
MPDGGGYRQRTQANVRDSDATLIISVEPYLCGGSHETALFAQQLAKPYLHLHPGMDWQQVLPVWIRATPIAVLNVAGPRASDAPAIGAFTMEVLDSLAVLVDINEPGIQAVWRN